MADKRIIDVAGPEDAKVDIGSKPMVAGHKIMMNDPMMRENAQEAETNNVGVDEVPAPVATKSEIEPPSVRQKIIEPSKPEEVEKPVENIPEQKPEEPLNTNEQKEPKEEIDPVAVQMEKDEELRKVIESKKYNVNIKQASTNNFKKWLLVFAGMLVVLVIAVFILIDTNVLDLGVKLPFRIFGKEDTTSTQSSNNTTTETSEQADSTVQQTPVAEKAETTQATKLKKITEVDILISKIGDETKLPTVTPAGFVDFLKKKIKTYDCSVDGGGYTIKKISDEFVSGLVGCEGGYAAYWYILDGQWQEFGTQDTPPCDNVESLKIPEEFIPTCLDLKTNTEKANPNGSINKS